MQVRYQAALRPDLKGYAVYRTESMRAGRGPQVPRAAPRPLSAPGVPPAQPAEDLLELRLHLVERELDAGDQGPDYKQSERHR